MAFGPVGSLVCGSEVCLEAWPVFRWGSDGAGRLTRREERDGLEAAVLRSIHLQAAQLVHLLLEGTHLVHEGHGPLGCHGRGMQPRGGQQRCRMQRQRRLRRVQHEELTPAEPQQRHLVGGRQLGEEGRVAGPLDRAEQQACRQLAHVVDAQYSAAATKASGRGVGLSTQQLRNQLGHWRPRERFDARRARGTAGRWTGERMRDAASLHGLLAHAHPEALLEPTVLTLVPVVLINLTVTVGPAGVAEIAADAALEETLAALAGEHAVMLSTGLVPAHHAVHLQPRTLLVARLRVAGRPGR